MKKIVSSLLFLAMTLSLAAVALAYDLRSFRDVPDTYWAYDAIMAMADRGLLSGTVEPDRNGVGTFEPEATMTQAQFIAVVVRYLYPDQLAEALAQPDDTPWYAEHWYADHWTLAYANGLVSDRMFDLDDLDRPMTRQQMAQVLAVACELLGEKAEPVADLRLIPDQDQIAAEYQSAVCIAYGKGLITGTDSLGTFDPQGSMTRAQAATVLYRLTEPGSRVPVQPGEEEA